jgi:dienelactone hydrolase
MWTKWVQPWADLFPQHGVGTAVVDSFGPRGVEQVCTRNPGRWAVRRADDAASAATWLIEQGHADPGRLVVMGMSNGGRTVLAALRTTLEHATAFAGGIALRPGCQGDVDRTFYAPLLVLIGRGDTVTPARFCEEMKARQAGPRRGDPDCVSARAPHTFDMPLPDRTRLGMRLGFDGEATADARRQAIGFLTARGLITGPTTR